MRLKKEQFTAESTKNAEKEKVIRVEKKDASDSLVDQKTIAEPIPLSAPIFQE